MDGSQGWSLNIKHDKNEKAAKEDDAQVPKVRQLLTKSRTEKLEVQNAPIPIKQTKYIQTSHSDIFITYDMLFIAELNLQSGNLIC